MSALKMLGSWIFVRPIEDKQEGKVIVPDTAKEVTQKGKVVYCKKTSKTVKTNDVVLFKRRVAYGAVNDVKMVEVDGEKYLPMKETELLGMMHPCRDTAVDIRAMGDNVFLEWEMAPDIYAGTNFIRPDSYKQMQFTGLVLSKGEKVNPNNKDNDIRVGDRVFFDQFCGVEKLQEDGKRFGFVKSWDVYCTNVPSREEMLASARRGRE